MESKERVDLECDDWFSDIGSLGEDIVLFFSGHNKFGGGGS
jgi:hypothetical protein